MPDSVIRIPRPNRIIAAFSLAAIMAASACAFAASAKGADAIYWGRNASPSTSSAIAKANIDGTGVNPNFIPVGSTVGGLAFNSTSVFWAGPNGVSSANLDGTGSSTLLYSGPSAPGLSIDGQYFYDGGATSAIGRASLDGSGMNTSFISTGTYNPTYTAVNASHIYWSGPGPGGGAIGRANIDGTGVNLTLISGLSSSPQGIAIDGSYIYWTNTGGTTIGRANLDGTGVNQSFITGLSSVTKAIAVDSNHLYWYSSATGNIARSNLDGTGVDSTFIAAAAQVGMSVYGIAVAPAGSAPKYALSVTKAGTGTGTVTSSPAGIDCGSTCTAEYASGTSVTLTAAAASGSTFSGWSGACSGAEATCTVSMSEARSVTANFALVPVPPTPSNAFKLSAASISGRSIRTRITVTDPGRISQRGTRATRSSAARVVSAAVCSTSRSASKAGTYTLTCKVNAATRKAQKKGAVRVLLTTTFTPTGGTARTAYRVAVLRSLKPRYTG